MGNSNRRKTGLISLDGMEKKVSLGCGEERAIMFHLLLQPIAALCLPAWGLRALTALRTTVVFPGARVSLASAPGNLSLTALLALQRIPEGRERYRAEKAKPAWHFASAPPHPTQVGGEPGHLPQGRCLSVSTYGAGLQPTKEVPYPWPEPRRSLGFQDGRGHAEKHTSIEWPPGTISITNVIFF